MAYLKAPFLIFLSAVIFIGSGVISHAHVKWFVDTHSASVEGFQPYGLFDTAVVVWALIAVVAIGVSVVLDKILPVIKIADTKTRHDFMEILRIFTGMSLLLTAYEGALLAPHMVAHGAMGTFLVFFQALIGILLIGNKFIYTVALMLLALLVGVVLQFGIVSVLEYFIYFGIALFLLLNCLQIETLVERYKPYSVPILRISAGISLATLAVTEKLTGALFGQAFLAEYQWNFMTMLGVEVFTDRLFVLSAGVCELILGIILILGTTTRLTMLAISLLMFTSNIVFIIQGNNEAALVEFVGHLPIIGTALVLMLLGCGQRLRLGDLLVGKST